MCYLKNGLNLVYLVEPLRKHSRDIALMVEMEPSKKKKVTLSPPRLDQLVPGHLAWWSGAEWRASAGLM